MTTANLFNVSSVGANSGMQVDAAKKLQEENLEIASVFSALMNQQVDLSNPVVGDGAEQSVVTQTEKISTPADSYDRYNYKENRIETVEKEAVAEVTEEVAEEFQQFEEDVIEAISEEYGVDKETVLKVLEENGLTVLDLLNPQNLAELVMELTGLTSTEEVLFDSSFLNVMETISDAKTDLMKELGVALKEFDDLVAQMEKMTLEGSESVEFKDVLDVQMNQQVDNAQTLTDTGVEVEAKADVVGDNKVETVPEKNNEAAVNTTTTTTTTTTSEAANTMVTEEVSNDDVTNNVTEATANAVVETEEQVTDEVVSTVVDDETQTKEAESKEDVEFAGKEQQDEVEQNAISSTETKSDTAANDKESTPFSNKESHEHMVMNNTVANDVTVEVPKMQTGAYTSVEPMQIIQQIAEQVRVFANADTTTMEMQLNPENLGKIYLHISSEEGVVNAQFTATNEVVKEALEAQLATLRENLTQAGVKVDAIEVTIASHEFEQNLEQNHRQAEKEGERQEEVSGRRRNLHVDSLDELSGLMTEEETLVAQMMRENGNSVDLTA